MATIQFDSAEQRREASLFGMWVFLATELLFFGPLFFGYVHGRVTHHEAFVSGSHAMHFWLGTINTAILLTSSFTVALAVERAKRGSPLRPLLSLTAVLGVAFLCIKSFEYVSEYRDAVQAQGGEAMFYFLYYAMTGVHAVHLAIGIGLVCWLWLTARGRRPARHTSVEVTGLYWHFVDVVWVFLYPMFYLLERYR